jgi:hypothetical protein
MRASRTWRLYCHRDDALAKLGTVTVPTTLRYILRFINHNIVKSNGLDLPKPMKIRYVDHAIPPLDALSEFVEKLIAPPITLPLLRIADHMPEMCEQSGHSKYHSRFLPR